jgi:hypothetical protein
VTLKTNLKMPHRVAEMLSEVVFRHNV